MKKYAVAFISAEGFRHENGESFVEKLRRNQDNGLHFTKLREKETNILVIMKMGRLLTLWHNSP